MCYCCCCCCCFDFMLCVNYFYSFHIKQNTRFKFIYQISPSMDWSIACHCFPLAKYKSSRWNSNILKTKITLARNIEVDKQSWWQSVIQFVLKMVSKPLWWHHTNNRNCTNIWNGCVFVMEISFGAEKRPTNTYKQKRSRSAHRTPHTFLIVAPTMRLSELQSHKIHTRSHYHKTRLSVLNNIICLNDLR